MILVVWFDIARDDESSVIPHYHSRFGRTLLMPSLGNQEFLDPEGRGLEPTVAIG